MVKFEKTFGEYFYRTLNEDENYSRYLDDLVLPSEKSKRKAKTSSVVGATLGATIGIGWRAQAGTVIVFKDCPISFASIFDSGKVRLHLQTSFPRGSYKKLWIETKTKGIVHKEIVGVGLRFENNNPMRLRIETDEDLMDDLLLLFMNDNFHDISEHTPAKVTIKVENGSNAQIEANLARDIPPKLVRKFFGCMLDIASYVRLGDALGIRRRIIWRGTTNKRVKTTTMEIPDNSDAPWDIFRRWILSWRPDEIKHWKKEWYAATKCKVHIFDADTDRLLKQVTLGCQRPHDGFEVGELDNNSEPLTIWGEIYFEIEVTGYEGQWKFEINFFDGAGLEISPNPEREYSIEETEQGLFARTPTSRYKAVYTDREGRHKKEYIIEFSTTEEFRNEMRRILDDWITETKVLNFWTVSISPA